MPSRIIREGIISSQRVNALSLGAEVLYRRLMSIADDYGRYHGSVLTLRVACFPTNPERFREKEVGKWFNELLRGENPLVKTFIVGGITYLEIQEFGQQRRGKSKFPDPPWFKDQQDAQETAKQAINRTDEGCLASDVANAQGSRSRSRISNAESYAIPDGGDSGEIPADAGLIFIADHHAPEVKRRKSGRSSEEIEKALGDERMQWWSQCWSIYPERSGKKAAMDTFERKVNTRELAIKVYKGVQQYAALVLADPTMRVKYFQGWLSDERWEDEATRIRAAPSPPPTANQVRRNEVVSGLRMLDQIRESKNAL